MRDAVKSKSSSNIFLVKDGEVKRSFYAGNLEMIYPYYICFVPSFGKISFFIEGAGGSAKVAGACNQPECTYIPINISDKEARELVKEAFLFGKEKTECRNCPTDISKEIAWLKPTRKNVEMWRKFSVCEGITNVEIIIRPKEGSEVKDFRFYELIPKDCINELSKYLGENIKGDVDIKSDPLIMWYFSSLNEEKRISYKLNATLSDECKKAIQGLGVAQFIKGEEAAAEANAAPTISGLPDATISGVKAHNNVIANLWQYSDDAETQKQKLEFYITKQTNKALAECSIKDTHIDCTVNRDENGFSDVTVGVSDEEYSTAEDTFRVNVKKNAGAVSASPQVKLTCTEIKYGDCGFNWKFKCKPEWCKEEFGDGWQYIGCDSCGRFNLKREPQCRKTWTSNCGEDCGTGSVTQQIQCCDSHAAQKCHDNDVYWLDSCNNREEKKEECGSYECAGYGSWQCKDSAAKQKTRTCYTKGCDAATNACYSNSFSDAEEETCAYGTQCENGECRVPTCTPKTCPQLGKQCGSWPNGCGSTLNCGGCGTGKTCQNGNCVGAVASLSASYSNLRKNSGSPPPGFGGGNWWYYDVTLKETSGNVGVTVNSRQKCYAASDGNNWCDPVKSNIAENFGTNYISPSGTIRESPNWVYFNPGYSYTTTETYWGTDNNGNSVTASYSFTVSS